MNATLETKQLRAVYFLSQILNVKVELSNGKKIGMLDDIVIEENGKLPLVKQLYIHRPFGDPALLVPLDKVSSMNAREIILDLDDIKPYEAVPGPEAILLKDHILDKKVLDIEDREVDIVYDVKMVYQDGKLYVSDVDMSKYGLLRRMHLKWLADMVYRFKERPNPEIISWKYIQPIPTSISSFKGDVKLNVLKEKLSEIPPADLADILEEMDRESRAMLFGQLETETASNALEEIDPSVQRDLVSSLKKDRVAQLINDMTPAQGADLLSVLPYDEVSAILELLDKTQSKKIQTILRKQQNKISDYSTHEFLTFPPEMTVEEVEVEYPKKAKGKDAAMYIYVVDESEKLIGVIDLKDLLLADDQVRLKDIMADQVVTLHPENTLKEVYKMFMRYSFRALPIVDENDKILGVVPYRDIMRLKHRLV